MLLLLRALFRTAVPIEPQRLTHQKDHQDAASNGCQRDCQSLYSDGRQRRRHLPVDAHAKTHEKYQYIHRCHHAFIQEAETAGHVPQSGRDKITEDQNPPIHENHHFLLPSSAV